MELHNTMEEIVIPKVEDIFNTIEKNGNSDKFCTCFQCRTDTACYVLNRVTPFYLVSNRGAARIHHENIDHQQKDADIITLIHEGLKRVNHNQRPGHDSAAESKKSAENEPVYNIPAVTGRLLNGNNFEPIANVSIKLLFNGSQVKMKDGHWQNPLQLVSHTEGAFSFWPISVPAERAGDSNTFEYTVRVEAEGYETLNHIFKIPVKSEILTAQSYQLGRTFKLPDLYLFPPGGDEQNRYLLP